MKSSLQGEFEPNFDIAYVYLFVAVALFILIIACINFMNLSTARSASRAKEVGIRKVMGSFRSHLMRQFLTESILLSFISIILEVLTACEDTLTKGHHKKGQISYKMKIYDKIATDKSTRFYKLLEMNVITKGFISMSIWLMCILTIHAQSVTDRHGAIVRGDTSQKVIALVLTGHEFADGGSSIRKTLKVKKVKASFFFTGDFYANPHFSKLIRQLKKDGHYLGAHSNKHLLYADWEKRDSTLVSADEFKHDLEDNYRKMAEYNITKADAHYFLPPYEWYNTEIASWTKQMNLTLINFSAGTRSAADYTYPQMGSRYLGSEEIYQSIMKYEYLHGMNGFILLVHIGTDPRRKDKLYNRLGNLIDEMKARGYEFRRVDDLLKAQ